ncbi:MAG TPA: low molecular weight phosphotyrosine protein phosphatase, partial [Rhodospirillales bacterium]|nr:low molecular weight phosphotyrosine protein phosphatase [Rhodospirillales bacterium]
DYILAMDQENLASLRAMAPDDSAHKVRLFLDFGPEGSGQNVPDPYYGQGNGFEVVLDLIEAAAAGLLADIRQKHL